MTKATKTGRIELRTEQSREGRIRFAAELSHKSLSAFILDAASSRAEEVISSASETSVPSDFFDKLWSSLDSPPGPNPALARRARTEPAVDARALFDRQRIVEYVAVDGNEETAQGGFQVAGIGEGRIRYGTGGSGIHSGRGGIGGVQGIAAGIRGGWRGRCGRRIGGGCGSNLGKNRTRAKRDRGDENAPHSRCPPSRDPVIHDPTRHGFRPPFKSWFHIPLPGS